MNLPQLTARSLLAPLTGLLILVAFTPPLSAETRDTDLTSIPIERLMDIEVISAAKKEQKLSQTAAAIYVITSEEIRRSGATTLAELMRLSPGMVVARVDNHQWAISARSFNDPFANKFLVLIDGRSVYSPTTSGVHWDVQDTLLEDIDRIEVIRGPGGSLWGANAVNGVINVITKKAQETQGGLLMGGGGVQERGFGGTRYGGQIGKNLFYRAYAKYTNRDNFTDLTGRSAFDTYQEVQGGTRSDWNISENDSLTLQGDFYDGDTGNRRTLPILTDPFATDIDEEINFRGGNFLQRWHHTFREDSNLEFQSYYDYNKRIHDAFYGERIHTGDFDFQHGFRLGGRQEMLWGGGYRIVADHLDTSFSVIPDPTRRTTHLFSGFLQDEITLVPERLRFTAGSKFEHNSDTGFEIQPTGRLLWTPHPDHTVWAAVSRAVRTPNRVESTFRSNNFAFLDPDTGLPILISVFGSRAYRSETVLANELGYRLQPRDNLSFDLATFLNFYDHLRTVELGSASLEVDPPPVHILVPLVFDNQAAGHTEGAELAARWRPWEKWQLVGTYTWTRTALHQKPGSTDTVAEAIHDNNPRHQFSARSFLDLPFRLEFDTLLFFVGPLDTNVHHYTRVDTRLGWHATKKMELSVAVQNIFAGRHLEFQSEFLNSTEVDRSIYGKLTWNF